MIKTCTNSRCRRPFDTALDTYRGWGPYCRKDYPRLPKAERFSLRGKPERLYGVILRSFGQNKIMAIKIVCKYRSIGLA